MQRIKPNPHKTILTICTGLLLISILTEIKSIILVSLIIGIIGVFSKYLSEKIERFWFMISKLLSYIIPNLVLSIVFYFFLFPISLFTKFLIKRSSKNKKYTIFNLCNRNKNI